MTAATVEQVAEVLREVFPLATADRVQHAAEQVAALGIAVREDEGGEGRG